MNITSIEFLDEQNGLANYYFENNPNAGYKLARTADGGEHWTAISGSPDFSEITAIPCTKTFVGIKFWAEGGGTSTSTDLGETWTEPGDTAQIWAPFFASPEHGWVASATATGANPALYKWSGGPLFGRTFVNHSATGANNGKTWADAFTDLKTALAAAKSGDEIWVAEGIYKPAPTVIDPGTTFLIDENLKLYGGFAGTECLLSERDPAQHPTVLSGDLNGDDVDNDFSQNRSDNVSNVMRINNGQTSATLIDGFTIEHGRRMEAAFNNMAAAFFASVRPLFETAFSGKILQRHWVEAFTSMAQAHRAASSRAVFLKKTLHPTRPEMHGAAAYSSTA